MAPSTYQAPQPLHRPHSSLSGHFPGSELPVLCIISCGSCFSYIPIPARPSPPQKAVLGPGIHFFMPDQQPSGTVDSWAGSVCGGDHPVCCRLSSGSLVPAHWMSVASPPHTLTSHANQSCLQALPKAPGRQDHSAWEPLC